MAESYNQFAMRFESKRDTWLVLTLRGTPVLVLAAISVAWYQAHQSIAGPLAGVLILIAAELFFFESVLRSTYYEIAGGTLLIHSSFITWRVPVADIRRITPTRSAMSSPALSLDRLRIDYAAKAILVSPVDKARFVTALRALNPAIIT